MTVARVAVEGAIDLAVAERLLAFVGLQARPLGRRNGREHVLAQIDQYNRAARFEPWLVIVDLDRDPCAPALVRQWLPNPSDGMTFRIAARAIESWLIADPELARWLKVPRRALALDPDEIPDPKRWLIEVVRNHCRNRDIRSAMLPRSNRGGIGPEYNATMIDFVRSRWQLEAASERSDSLRRAIDSLSRIHQALD